jgi:hypothetical protein
MNTQDLRSRAAVYNLYRDIPRICGFWTHGLVCLGVLAEKVRMLRAAIASTLLDC